MTYNYTTNNNRVTALSEHDLHTYLGSILGEKYVSYRQEWENYNTQKLVSPFPLYLVLEQQYKCNLRCPMCLMSYPEKEKYRTDVDYMDDGVFSAILSEAKQYGCPSLSMNNTEEPLLSKNIIGRIKEAKEHGFIDIFMNTNGTLLTPEMSEQLIDSGLTRLLIGFDGFTKETYEKVRQGACYERVFENIMTFLSIRQKKKALLPVVRISFVVNDINRHEVDAFREFWLPRVEYVAFQEYYAPPVENALLVSQRKVQKNGVSCDQLYNRLLIRSNGDVCPCCTFWGYHMVIGNIKNARLYDLWHSKKMDELRASFDTNTINKWCQQCLAYS